MLAKQTQDRARKDTESKYKELSKAMDDREAELAAEKALELAQHSGQAQRYDCAAPSCSFNRQERKSSSEM